MQYIPYRPRRGGLTITNLIYTYYIERLNDIMVIRMVNLNKVPKLDENILPIMEDYINLNKVPKLDEIILPIMEDYVNLYKVPKLDEKILPVMEDLTL